MHDKIEKFQEILKEDLKKELDKINNAGTVTPENLNVIDKAADVMLDLIKIDDWEMGEGENSYYDGYSNRRGRSATTGRYVSRDARSMRSYDDMPMESDSYRGSSNRYYDDPYMRGYSGRGRMIDELERMYKDAATESERRMIKEWIDNAQMNR